MPALRAHVLAASGGVGATVLAAAVAARASRRGLRAVLVERWRGGLDVVCGIDGLPGLRLDDLVDVDGEPDAARLTAALPRNGEVVVLAHECDGVGPVLTDEQHRSVLEALARSCDLLVVDAGGLRRTAACEVTDDPGAPAGAAGPGARVVVVGGRAHQLALAAGVVPPLVQACSDTRWPDLRPVLLAVAAPGPDPCLVADALGLPTATRIPDDDAVGRSLDAAAMPGRRGRGGLVRAADELLDRLGAVAPGDRPDRGPGRGSQQEWTHVPG